MVRGIPQAIKCKWPYRTHSYSPVLIVSNNLSLRSFNRSSLLPDVMHLALAIKSASSNCKSFCNSYKVQIIIT